MSDDLTFDPSRFRKDAGARSLSYYSLDSTVGVDERMIDTLVAESDRAGGVYVALSERRTAEALRAAADTH